MGMELILRRKSIMADNELWFTALGPSGAGKTTMLACMQKKFDELLSGSIIADTGTFSTLNAAYQKLEDEANGKAFEFGIGIENTENLREYSFTLKGRNANVPMRFFDFPGGWIDSVRSQPENYDRVMDIVKRSHVVIVAVNTPYLMEAGGRYKKEARIDDIEQVIKASLLNSEGGKLILIVPIKYEKYTRNDKEKARLFTTIEKAFAVTMNLAANPVYKDRLAIATIPIETAGNVQFSRFEAQDGGRLPREIYYKNRSKGFRPKDADQPLRYAMSFLLNEFARDNGSSLRNVFSRNDIKELGDFVRDGMNTGEGIKIYCDRELITEMPDVVEGNNSYMFRQMEAPKPEPTPQTPIELEKSSNMDGLAKALCGVIFLISGIGFLSSLPLLGIIGMGLGLYLVVTGANK